MESIVPNVNITIYAYDKFWEQTYKCLKDNNCCKINVRMEEKNK